MARAQGRTTAMVHQILEHGRDVTCVLPRREMFGYFANLVRNEAVARGVEPKAIERPRADELVVDGQSMRLLSEAEINWDPSRHLALSRRRVFVDHAVFLARRARVDIEARGLWPA